MEHSMKVALVQMVSGTGVDKNIAQLERLLKPLVTQKLDLIVLPEMFLCLGVKDQVGIAKNHCTQSDILKLLGGWSKKLGAYIVGGSVPILDECSPTKVRAASLLISPQAHIVKRYDKIHLFDVDVADNKGSYRESDTFLPGSEPAIAYVNGHALGMSVCYDLRFPELYQFYQSKACELITVPSAFTYQTGKAHWEILLRARAIETQSFVLAANQGGKHDDGRQTWGHSMVVHPDGRILAQVNDPGPGVVTATINFDDMKSIHINMPLRQHKRL